MLLGELQRREDDEPHHHHFLSLLLPLLSHHDGNDDDDNGICEKNAILQPQSPKLEIDTSNVLLQDRRELLVKLIQIHGCGWKSFSDPLDGDLALKSED